MKQRRGSNQTMASGQGELTGGKNPETDVSGSSALLKRSRLDRPHARSVRKLAIFLALALVLGSAAAHASENATFVNAAKAVLPKVVKIFGAGGAARLEGYQSGLVISGQGHVLTAWSYVLDEDEVTVVLADGQRFEAKLVGADPRMEIALLKLDYDDDDLPYFPLAEAVKVAPGGRVLAFSNIFRVATGNEPVSLQHGVVSAVAPLAIHGGKTSARFRGDVYFVDAIINNPGAAGGALTDRQGRLVGLLGKELRSSGSNTWFNYAIPVAAFAGRVGEMIAGRFIAADLEHEGPRPERPLTTADLGFVLVPDVVARTPPFIDAVRPATTAAEEGIRPDDLVVFVDDRLVPSCRALRKALARHEHDMPIQVTVLRGDQMVEFTLQAGEETP